MFKIIAIYEAKQITTRTKLPEIHLIVSYEQPCSYAMANNESSGQQPGQQS